MGYTYRIDLSEKAWHESCPPGKPWHENRRIAKEVKGLAVRVGQAVAAGFVQLLGNADISESQYDENTLQ